MGRRVDTIEDEIIKEVALELGLRASVVRDMIINGQSRFTAQAISSGMFDSIRWPYFGIFKVKPKHVQMVMYRRGVSLPVRRLLDHKILKTPHQKNTKLTKDEALKT